MVSSIESYRQARTLCSLILRDGRSIMKMFEILKILSGIFAYRKEVKDIL
jgi:hypothetical protein